MELSLDINEISLASSSSNPLAIVTLAGKKTTLHFGGHPHPKYGFRDIIKCNFGLIVSLIEEQEYVNKGDYRPLLNGIDCFHFPIPDRTAPSRELLTEIIQRVRAWIEQNIGRD